MVFFVVILNKSVFNKDCVIEEIIVVLFGELVINIMLLFFFIKVGVIEESICLQGVMVFVLLFIVLKKLGMSGFVLKLFILLLSKKFVLDIIILLLKVRLMVVVLVIVLFQWFKIEKWVVFLFFFRSGLIFLVIEILWRLIVFVWVLIQLGVISVLMGMFIKLGLFIYCVLFVKICLLILDII